METWTGLVWLRIRAGGGRRSYECGDERLGSIQSAEFLD
jgi:hypothetical protein